MKQFELRTGSVFVPPGQKIEDAFASEDAQYFSGYGRILFAGLAANGVNKVGFVPDVQGGNYQSTWPSWAYDLAKQALLADRKVYVQANQPDPFGEYLVYVWIFAPWHVPPVGSP